MLPKVSFCIPTLNAGKLIDRCLGSIRKQNYPEELIEIVLADGGSTDNTIRIAKSYGCSVLYNRKKFAEPGTALALEKGTGDIEFIIAADNELPRENWIKLMVKPFMKEKKVWGVFTQIVPSPDTNSFNRYYSLLHVEPFTWFIYKEASNPRLFHKIYKTIDRRDNYTIYDFSPMNHPLVAFAQGFALRKGFVRKKEHEYDDILPFIRMIEEGYQIAYVPEAGIYHHHLESFRGYLKKYQWRIRNSLQGSNTGFTKRKKYISSQREFRKYLWMLYGLSFILPLADGIRWYLRDKNRAWLWHSLACFGLTVEIVLEIGRKFLRGVFADIQRKRKEV